jgi:hypothetical protein
MTAGRAKLMKTKRKSAVTGGLKELQLSLHHVSEVDSTMSPLRGEKLCITFSSSANPQQVVFWSPN